MLYLVPTPIGNLKDITLRALEVLKNSDAIICEDTRRTGILLNHFEIKKPMYQLNDFTESKDYPRFINMLNEGKNLSLVSDAGTPLINDPGYKLVNACIQLGIPVDSLPGACAYITALTLSGLPTQRILFLGYPPEKSGRRFNFFEQNINIEKDLGTTLIFYVSPHKLLKTLEDLDRLIPNTQITLASEITKLHQKVDSHTPKQWIENFKATPKGEFVMLFNINKAV